MENGCFLPSLKTEDFMGVSMIRIDKSKLLLFLSDKREFKKIYLDKVKIPPSPYMSRGSFIHKIVEDELVKLGVLWEIAKDKEEYVSSVLNYLAKQYSTQKVGKGWTNSAITKTYSFLISFFNKYPFYPLKVESKFEWTDEKNKITFVGKPDAIFHLINDGRLMLVDWKVSNYRRRVRKVVNGVNLNSFEVNYYIWLMEKLGRKVDVGAIIPLTSSKPRFLLITPQTDVFEGIVYKIVGEIREFLKVNGFEEENL